mmetsp:Transcript_52336/g.124939  ORF Transcript_52336/g.124939 Transcript_52336/m.124939 type:complete len:203 (+) Transcript_52336:307-915(+)
MIGCRGDTRVDSCTSVSCTGSKRGLIPIAEGALSRGGARTWPSVEALTPGGGHMSRGESQPRGLSTGGSFNGAPANPLCNSVVGTYSKVGFSGGNRADNAVFAASLGSPCTWGRGAFFGEFRARTSRLSRSRASSASLLAAIFNGILGTGGGCNGLRGKFRRGGAAGATGAFAITSSPGCSSSVSTGGCPSSSFWSSSGILA